MDEWERRLVKEVREALGIIAKYGTEKSTILVHFKGKEYKGVKVVDWEKRD